MLSASKKSSSRQQSKTPRKRAANQLREDASYLTKVSPIWLIRVASSGGVCPRIMAMASVIAAVAILVITNGNLIGHFGGIWLNLVQEGIPDL